ncbi:DUF3383 family protein [Commensalibacter melissae]|uniref:DUF3383 family protein n=1 Tax=Commensalibacter melissae TaxID=2070537 RepID=UPI000EFA43F2|nr:DUF3383 family protein [Commensalibacter melissae]AYN86411.1 DUF3383 domain-containing protein [Commensalibacter melissae]
MSIPLNNIVRINPKVLSVGNKGNDLFGLMLTRKENVIPAGITSIFENAEEIGKLFGYDSMEYNLATVYFAGFTDSDRVATQLYMALYAENNTSAGLIGATMSAVTLEELRSFKGDLQIVIDNNEKNIVDPDFSFINSFSEAATILENLLGVSVVYSSGNQSFIITSGLTGHNSYVSFATGQLADLLRLSENQGASLSPAIESPTPSSVINTLRKENLTFCSVFLTWEPDEAEALTFAKWADSMKDDVCVILSDSSNKAITANTGTSFAEKVYSANYEGVVCVYNSLELCAFIAGYPAAWDLEKTDGRYNAAFRRSSLLKANVTNEDIALALKANGYNFYGVWASASNDFVFMMEGKISGQYLWLDSWYCQVWMRRYFQNCFIKTLLAKGQIPYNNEGKGILSAAIKPAIDDFIKFGAIRSGIYLSEDQTQSLKQAGLNLSQINNITAVGYYLKIDMGNVTPQTRVRRGSPPINFWYTDGQSVQQINMNSIELQ